MFGNTVKVKIEKDLMDRIRKVADVAGYATPEEFVVETPDEAVPDPAEEVPIVVIEEEAPAEDPPPPPEPEPEVAEQDVEQLLGSYTDRELGKRHLKVMCPTLGKVRIAQVLCTSPPILQFIQKNVTLTFS